MFESIIMINGKDDLSRVNYRFQVIAVASANSQFPPGKLALSKFRPHLHTIPAHVSIYHFRQFSATPGRTPTRCVAALRRYLPLTVRRLRVSIENTPSSAPLPAFSSRCVCVLFKQLPSATFFKRSPVSAHATGRAIHAHAESDRAIISLLSEILKTTETKSMRSYFSYSIHSTDLTSTPISPLISTFLLYFDCLLTSLSVYALTGKVGTWKECGSNWLIQLISTGS